MTTFCARYHNQIYIFYPNLPLWKVSKQLRTMQGKSYNCWLLTLSTTDTFTFIFQNLTTPNLEFYFCNVVVTVQKQSTIARIFLHCSELFRNVTAKILDAVTYNSLFKFFSGSKYYCWTKKFFGQFKSFINLWNSWTAQVVESTSSSCFIASIVGNHQISFTFIVSKSYKIQASGATRGG